MPRPLTLLALGFFVALTLALIAPAQAATSGGRSVERAPKRASQAQLGTSFRFDGSSLQGKLQSAPATTATVEDDKFLNDLLASRSNFRDRISEDEMRY